MAGPAPEQWSRVLEFLRSQPGLYVGQEADGLFTSSAPERFRARRDVIEYVTTDTVSDYRGSDIPNLHVLSVAPLLGEAMRRIHVGESVSSLFGSTEWTTTATPQQASL